MKVIIIIPAYNEEENIINTVNSLKETKIEGIKLDYIVVNDGSTDNTRKVLIDNKVKFIDLVYNLGIGGAVQTGYKYAFYNNYDIAIQFDGDGQHNPIYIKDLIDKVKEANDLVIGSRFIIKDDSFKSTGMRRFGIGFLSKLIKLCTGTLIKDPTSGFRACNKDVIRFFANNYPYDYPEPDTSVMVLKHGYRIAEIPVQMNERKRGKSSITPLKSIYYMIKVSTSIIVSSLEKRGEK